jgi:hypothetical protein
MGYIDFLGRKYRMEDKPYVIYIMKQMTDEEKSNLLPTRSMRSENISGAASPWEKMITTGPRLRL